MPDVIECQPSQERLEEFLREWGADDDDLRANRQRHGGRLYVSPSWLFHANNGFPGGHSNGAMLFTDFAKGEASTEGEP